MFGQCTNGNKTGLTRAIKNKAGRTIDKKTRQKKFLKSQTDGEGKASSIPFDSRAAEEISTETKNKIYGARKQMKVGKASFPVIN